MPTLRPPAAGGLSLLVLLPQLLLAAPSEANPWLLGDADGSFETGLHGATTTGDVRLVTALGALRPSQGTQALLLTTHPDAGVAPETATVSALSIAHITIPAGTTHLRLDGNFLTNELAPSFLNDHVTVRLHTAVDSTTLRTIDTYAALVAVPVPGYARQTGFLALVADVTAYAGTGEEVTLEVQLSDVGDGRVTSALLLDNLRLTGPEVPRACTLTPVTLVAPGSPAFVNSDCAQGGTSPIVEYRWNFGDGTLAVGRFPSHTYAHDGLYQGTLTVTTATGHSDTLPFLVAVGVLARAPRIVSTPGLHAAERTPYRYALVVEDADLAQGDTLTFTLLEAPSGMTITPGTGLLTWTPPLDAPRQPHITIQVQDAFGLSATQAFTLLVGPEVYVVAADVNGQLYYARSQGDGTFTDYHVIGGPGGHTESVVIADFDGDGDFDVISGQAQAPFIDLYYYEKQGGAFAPPVLLERLGSSSNSAGDWLMGMAASDVNRDGQMDVVVTSDTVQSWLLLRQGALTFGQATFLVTDFESDAGLWSTPTCRTGAARDQTTAASGSWSMRVFATSAASCLSLPLLPSGWEIKQGPTLSVAYRIPAGVPVGLYLTVTGVGQIFVTGTATAQPGTAPVLTTVPLVDDNTWRTLTLDLYTSLRARWPTATTITRVEWGTNANAPAGTQFWFDDFAVTRRTYVSGFQRRTLPNAGGRGRGVAMGDVQGDGVPDLVLGLCCVGQMILYSGDGTGQFTTATLFNKGTEPYGVALADFDQDGKVDLIAHEGASGKSSFFKGLGTSTFQAGVALPSLTTPVDAAYRAYDFNGDGHQDLVVVTHTARQMWYYPGRGDGTFGTPLLIGATANNVLGVAAPAGRVPGQPFSVVTVDRPTAAVGETVTLDASGSYDEGPIATYGWTFGDGTTASGAMVPHTFAREGLYTVVLTVTDTTGRQDRRNVSITVHGQPPVAGLTGPAVADEPFAALGQWTVPYDVSSTSDDVAIAAIRWNGAMAAARSSRPCMKPLTMAISRRRRGGRSLGARGG